jgi:hypothetical protein
VRPARYGKDPHQEDFVGKDGEGNQEYRKKERHSSAFPTGEQILPEGHF